ncbi:hypothetical protein YC2023_059492 [Brassica napus]
MLDWLVRPEGLLLLLQLTIHWFMSLWSRLRPKIRRLSSSRMTMLKSGLSCSKTERLWSKTMFSPRPCCRSLGADSIMAVVRQQQRRSIPSTLFSLSLNRDASSLSCDESNSVSLENQSKVGEDRATASEKTEQRRRGRQSRGGVGVERDGREQRWWCGG